MKQLDTRALDFFVPGMLKTVHDHIIPLDIPATIKYSTDKDHDSEFKDVIGWIDSLEHNNIIYLNIENSELTKLQESSLSAAMIGCAHIILSQYRMLWHLENIMKRNMNIRGILETGQKILMDECSKFAFSVLDDGIGHGITQVMEVYKLIYGIKAQREAAVDNIIQFKPRDIDRN